MKVKGHVMRGISRGADLVSVYYPRLIHLMKCKPHKGTLDVKMEKAIDTRPYATLFVDRILMNGDRVINLYIIPVNMRFKKKSEDSSKEEFIEIRCWIIRQERSVHRDDVAEIVCDQNLKKKYGLDDGDEIELEFLSKKNVKKDNVVIKSVKRLYGLRGGGD